MKKKYEQEDYDLEREDLIIPEKEEWKERMSKKVDEWLIDMKDSVYGYIPADKDDYDHSGDVYKVENLEDYVEKTFFYGDFLDNLYTGSRDATHVSGCGWRYITYGDEIREMLRCELYDEVCRLNMEQCWWFESEDDKKAYINEIFADTKEALLYPYELTWEYTKERVKKLWGME